MHPITKEKLYLKKLAGKIVDCKLQLTDLYYDVHNARDIQTMANKQRELARLKRAARNRHIAYCLTRQGNTEMTRPSMRCSSGIESPNTATKPNMEVVNRHRVRLLTEINKFYSDRHEKMLKRDRPEPRSWIEEFAPVTENAWQKISNITVPICEFVPGDDVFGKPQILYIEDFTQDSAGNFVYTVKEPGTVYCQNFERPVKPEDTLNIEKDELKNSELLGMMCKNDKPQHIFKVDIDFNDELPSPGEAWQDHMDDECPNFLGPYMGGLSSTETDECSLGGLCTDEYPDCRHYQEASTWK